MTDNVERTVVELTAEEKTRLDPLAKALDLAGLDVPKGWSLYRAAQAFERDFLMSFPVRREPERIWVAAYADHSGIYLYPTEIEALRDAVENGLTIVKQLPIDGKLNLLEELR